MSNFIAMILLSFSKYQGRNEIASSWREMIECLIKAHPKECIFAKNAVDNAYAEVMAWFPTFKTEVFVQAIRNQEIYCPHEGIDRR